MKTQHGDMAQPDTGPGGTLEFADTQSLVFTTGARFSGGVDLAFAAYELLRITDPGLAGSWLTRLADRLTTGEDCRKAHDADSLGPLAGDCFTNLAVTVSGLRALGLSSGEIATFDVAFAAGMTSPRTAQVLGDTAQYGADHAQWEWGGEAELHLLLLIAAASQTQLDAALARERDGYAGVAPLRAEPLLATRPEPPPDAVDSARVDGPPREHFGFADGLSQPDVAGFPAWARSRYRAPDEQPGVAIGEFVLGYRDAYGYRTRMPSLHGSQGPQPVGRNGSYLVLRQLEQDVAGFWNALDWTTKGDRAALEVLAAKCVGRWPSGQPLRKGVARDPGLSGPPGFVNAFDYSDDRQGYGCPVGSHVRRANPRAVGLGQTPHESLTVANRHRILRRGRSYGPRIADRFKDDGARRGIYFGCINANIERQFEVVQRSWIDSPVFGGLQGERDPLVGRAPPGDRGRFSVPEHPLRRRVAGLSRFVTVKGGAYFFLPGIRGLRQLAGGSPDRPAAVSGAKSI